MFDADMLYDVFNADVLPCEVRQLPNDQTAIFTFSHRRPAHRCLFKTDHVHNDPS